MQAIDNNLLNGKCDSLLVYNHSAGGGGGGGGGGRECVEQIATNSSTNCTYGWHVDVSH